MGMQWPHPDIKAHGEAYAMESKTIVAKDGDRQQLDFTIYPGAYGSIDVTNPGDPPIERMVVDVVRDGLDSSTRDSYIRTTAIGGGSWSFVGAPAGDHVAAATVRLPGGSRFFYSAPVKLELGQEARMRIELDEGIELRVRSVDPSGKPITLDSLAAFDHLHRKVYERNMLGSIVNESVLRVPRGTINLIGRAETCVGDIQVDTTDGMPRSIVLRLHAK